jgi:hypothetical protein
MRIAVQVGEASDIVHDSTVHWPKDRPEIDLGTVELSGVPQITMPSSATSSSTRSPVWTESSRPATRCWIPARSRIW